MISLVRRKARSSAGISAQAAPSDGAGDDHRDDQDRRRLRPRAAEPDAGGADRAEVELALAADVEQAMRNATAAASPVNSERRRGDQRVRERAVREVTPRRRAAGSRDRVVAGRDEQDARSATSATTSEPSGHRDHRASAAARAASRCGAAEFTRRPCGAIAAAISSPSSSTRRARRVDLADDRAPRTSRRSGRRGSASRRGPR